MSRKDNMVLIAEDEEISYMLLSNLMKGVGVKFMRAINGVEAVDITRQQPEIKMILMDINMPEMDGFEATRQIKSFRRDLPIIAVTAYILDHTENHAKEVGCDAYITKPIDKDLLFKTMSGLGVRINGQGR